MRCKIIRFFLWNIFPIQWFKKIKESEIVTDVGLENWNSLNIIRENLMGTKETLAPIGNNIEYDEWYVWD